MNTTQETLGVMLEQINELSIQFINREELTKYLDKFTSELIQLSKEQRNKTLYNISNALSTFSLYIQQGYSPLDAWNKSKKIIEHGI